MRQMRSERQQMSSMNFQSIKCTQDTALRDNLACNAAVAARLAVQQTFDSLLRRATSLLSFQAKIHLSTNFLLLLSITHKFTINKENIINEKGLLTKMGQRNEANLRVKVSHLTIFYRNPR